MSGLNKMTPDERWEWQWKALPSWAKFYTMLIGVPSFSILVWDVFSGSIEESVKIISFCAFASVAIVQIFCLNRIIRGGDR